MKRVAMHAINRLVGNETLGKYQETLLDCEPTHNKSADKIVLT